MTIGLLVVIGALCVIVFLVLWGRRSINRTAYNGFGSARKIMKERNRGG